jgi:hypothetical protein
MGVEEDTKEGPQDKALDLGEAGEDESFVQLVGISDVAILQVRLGHVTSPGPGAGAA